MKLKQEQFDVALAKIQKNDKPQLCPVCQKGDWLISDTIFELRGFNQGSIVIGSDSKVYPVFVLACKECGYTRLFSAISLGLVDKKEQKGI